MAANSGLVKFDPIVDRKLPSCPFKFHVMEIPNVPAARHFSLQPDLIMSSSFRHVAVLGAAGGLGQAVLDACRTQGISFTAIVRSRPERIADRIADTPSSRVSVVLSLADREALTIAFGGADAVISAIGVTSSSNDDSALISHNITHVEAAMSAANVDRLVLVSSIVAPRPGETPNWFLWAFTYMPGNMGCGAREFQALTNALGNGALASLRWTLVRAAVHSTGADEEPAASVDWNVPDCRNSMKPVSYGAMARWMVHEARAGVFVGAAPLVSRPKAL
ncbi:Aste57867_13872 [Aphanomyces stellatus]|uniref:Aste57867_13872 protein n=1 Tax=Aphanomyces stellatus TaxID=120398 RepID=A0A485L058_9STRA|nr:hypothetical protein As57867_013821 [Aphanomyces stellatus]VFT90703.1 Aste57867_13872 [Aphanomyces stellatus]